jgi:hypothetical protein
MAKRNEEAYFCECGRSDLHLLNISEEQYRQLKKTYPQCWIQNRSCQVRGYFVIAAMAKHLIVTEVDPNGKA